MPLWTKGGIKLNIITLFLLLHIPWVVGDQGYVYHFAEFTGLVPIHPERQNVRPELARNIALRAYVGDILNIYLCTSRWLNISFSNLTYSNDGAPENISLHFDSHYVGQFTTHSLSNWGYNWDKFYGSGFLGSSGLVPPGKHVITLKIVSSDDCYGVELGELSINTSKTVDQTSIWCGQELNVVKSKCLPKGVDTSGIVENYSPTPTTEKPPRYIQVRQLSYTSDCIDKQNVKIAFTSDNLTGTQITIKQEPFLTTGSDMGSLSDHWTYEARQCKSNMWQLGKVDGENSEFENIYPGRELVINVSSNHDPTKKFPAKILPFVTRTITLNFQIPPTLRIAEGGSAFFVLGLVNLTIESQIGLQMFNSSTNAFSEIHYQTFTPLWKVRGWHLPEFWHSSTQNSFKLHFISNANLIMFDFLKLDFSLREERKQNMLIARRGNLKVRGLRYSTSIGVTVVVDDREIVYNMEDVVIFYKKFSRYEVVLRIHYTGVLYPYKTYNVPESSARQQQQQQIVDVSGLTFSKGEPRNRRAHTSTHISSVYIDTPGELITINHEDGSSARLRLTADGASTRITVLSYQTNNKDIGSNANDRHTLFFVSTHVNDAVAAVNDISVPSELKTPITSDLANFSGEYNYTLTQTKMSSMFYVNNYFNIQFPH